LNTTLQFADHLHGKEQLMVKPVDEVRDPWIGLCAFAPLADHIGIEKKHAYSRFGAKSESKPTFGIDFKISLSDLLRGLRRAASRIARCSASALRPLRTACSFNDLTISASTFLTIKLVAMGCLLPMIAMIAF
jgi:hypothetical protein